MRGCMRCNHDLVVDTFQAPDGAMLRPSDWTLYAFPACAPLIDKSAGTSSASHYAASMSEASDVPAVLEDSFS